MVGSNRRQGNGCNPVKKVRVRRDDCPILSEKAQVFFGLDSALLCLFCLLIQTLSSVTANQVQLEEMENCIRNMI